MFTCPAIKSNNKKDNENDVNDVVLVSLLLTLNIFHIDLGHAKWGASQFCFRICEELIAKFVRETAMSVVQFQPT